MTHKKNLNNFIDSLIRDNKTVTREGYSLFVSDLCETDKEDFAAYLIESDSHYKKGWDFLLDDTSNNDLAGMFAQFLLSYGDKKEELKETFLNALKKSAIKRQYHKMQNLIDERIDTVYQQDQWEMAHPSDNDYSYQEASYL